MNTAHFDQVIANYIAKFEVMNNAKPHFETYKWTIAKQFKPMMDSALASQDSELPDALLEIRKLTQGLIDSITWPVLALAEYAKYEPATVRQMFLDLYADDGNDLALRMKKITSFLQQDKDLKKKYFPTSFKFENSIHSVTSYQTLYDPENYYILKPEHCKKFADCIEFYDSWGSGQNTKLDVFYRMCDQIVKYIENNDALMKTHASRFELLPAEKLHPDAAHHLLAFDIIYCCSTYGLFHGITFNPVPNPKERALLEELHKKAITASNNLEKARNEAEEYETIMDEIRSLLTPGIHVKSKANGDGVLKKYINHDTVLIQYPSIGKTLKIKLGGNNGALVNKFIYLDNEEFTSLVQKNKVLLSSELFIAGNLRTCEYEFEKYEPYLE